MEIPPIRLPSPPHREEPEEEITIPFDPDDETVIAGGGQMMMEGPTFEETEMILDRGLVRMQERIRANEARRAFEEGSNTD